MSNHDDLQEIIDPVTALQRRRSRRRSVKRAFNKWSRACWPFLFVAGAAVLSAGVVRVVETAPQPIPRADVAPPDVPQFSPVDNLLDVEFFDQHFYWDESRIEQASRSQRQQITLPREIDRRYDLMANESVIEDPARVPIDPAELPLPVDDAAALPSVEAAPPVSAPALWLLGSALCLVAMRFAVGLTRAPAAATRRS